MTRRKSKHIVDAAEALEKAVSRAQKNFDHEALKAFLDQATEQGAPPHNHDHHDHHDGGYDVYEASKALPTVWFVVLRR